MALFASHPQGVKLQSPALTRRGHRCEMVRFWSSYDSLQTSGGPGTPEDGWRNHIARRCRCCELGAHPRSKTREEARRRFGHSHRSLPRRLVHWGSHELPGPLQKHHGGGPTTAAANAINERDAAPDAAVRRPPRRARRGRGENPRPQQNHEAAPRGDEAADHSQALGNSHRRAARGAGPPH